jgi:hypothetical protein
MINPETMVCGIRSTAHPVTIPMSIGKACDSNRPREYAITIPRGTGSMADKTTIKKSKR